MIGSNSFLGRAITAELWDSGAQVDGLYHINKDQLFNKATHYPVSGMKHLQHSYTTVFLVSAYIPAKGEEGMEERLAEVNEQLVEDVCKAFPESKLVYCSTVSVYGNSLEPLNESSPAAPESPYGRSKLAGEQIAAGHPDHAIVRISSMYGPGMKLHTFLPAVIGQALEHREVHIFGDGSRLQNYVHVNDVARFAIRAAERPESDTYLAVSNESTSNLEVAELVSLKVGNTKITFGGKDESASYVYNNEYTRRTLGNEAATPLDRGLTELIEWIRKQY